MCVWGGGDGVARSPENPAEFTRIRAVRPCPHRAHQPELLFVCVCARLRASAVVRYHASDCVRLSAACCVFETCHTRHSCQHHLLSLASQHGCTLSMICSCYAHPLVCAGSFDVMFPIACVLRLWALSHADLFFVHSLLPAPLAVVSVTARLYCLDGLFVVCSSSRRTRSYDTLSSSKLACPPIYTVGADGVPERTRRGAYVAARAQCARAARVRTAVRRVAKCVCGHVRHAHARCVRNASALRTWANPFLDRDT